MRIGLISDTHDNLVLSRTAAAWFRSEAPETVLHLGDITTPECAELFRELPMVFLRGNNDREPSLVEGLEVRGLPPLLDTWVGAFDGTTVAATHGHIRGSVDRLAKAHDIVLHGHTHRVRVEQVGDALIVNPGALHRVAVKTIAMLDMATLNVTHYVVSESGVRPRD